MDPTTAQITGYFRAIQTQANLQDCAFTSRTPFTTVSSEALAEGRLDAATTDELFNLAKQSRRRPLDLLVSLVTLQDGVRAEGLALIAAQLDAEGRLTADLGAQPPWIPASRLRSPGVTDRQLMVGALTDFWSWRLSEAEERVSQAEEWADVLTYTEAMVEAVFDAELIDAGLDAEPRAELHRPGPEPHRCWITPDTVIQANTAILDLYRHLIDSDASPDLYESLLSLEPLERISADDIDQRSGILLESTLRTAGSMSDGFPLTASQRRAVHAFMLDGPGDVTAVSGPPGTGKTTMLQAVVASLIVRHCLEDRPAPLAAGCHGGRSRAAAPARAGGLRALRDEGQGGTGQGLPAGGCPEVRRLHAVLHAGVCEGRDGPLPRRHGRICGRRRLLGTQGPCWG